jgi:CheY-like chemotaxis protein
LSVLEKGRSSESRQNRERRCGGTALPGERTGPQTPHLVLLVIKIPLKDGFEVLERVRQNPKLKCTPVIIFSASAQEQDVKRAYDLGANSYIVKPNDPERLEEFVSKIHDYWLNFNAMPSFVEETYLFDEASNW